MTPAIAKAPPKTREIQLGDKAYTVGRLGTRDALNIAQSILSYGRKLQAPFQKFQKYSNNNNQEEIVEVGLDLLSELAELVKEEDLLNLASRILSIPPEEVGDAPLEDVLNAIADAFELNNMPALLDAARRIWTNANRFANRNDKGA